ncbi:MAG TPA: sugar kinase [Bacilli bacterium]
MTDARDKRDCAVDVVTFGESMVLFTPMQETPLAYASLYIKSVAGAEGNFGVGLARLGKKVRWISRLGTDPFGDFVQSTLAGEGLDVSRVIRDETHPTAVFFKENKSAGDPRVFYYRKHSAASRLHPDDVREDWFSDARHLHVTGITPALGEHTGEMVIAAMKMAKAQGLTVSFDPNIRFKLWDEATARSTLLAMLPLCDIFLPGIEEAEFLIGEKPVEQYGRAFLEMGPKVVALKLGAEGSIGFARGFAAKAAGFPVPRIVDTVGAGDAFAAGFMSVILDTEIGRLTEETLTAALTRGNLLGSMATQFRGDWEGLPTLAEVERRLAGGKDRTR